MSLSRSALRDEVWLDNGRNARAMDGNAELAANVQAVTKELAAVKDPHLVKLGCTIQARPRRQAIDEFLAKP